MHINHHGGNCCGIRHIWDFNSLNNETPDGRAQRVRDAIEISIDYFRDADGYLSGMGEAENFSCGLEAVLACYQLDDWREPVEKCGFREVFSFENGNTGHRCHVFYLNPNEGEQL